MNEAKEELKKEERNLLVSIIVISRNAKSTIRKCLDSILSQTYPNIEVVVVDSSEDGTEKIVEEYAEKSKFPFKIIRQEPKGVAAARNAGIENAKGEVLLYVDADCYIPADYVEKAVIPFIKSDSTLTVFTNMEVSSASSSFFGNLVTLYEKIMPSISHIITTHLVRKKLYNLIGQYNNNLKSGEDAELLNRLLKERKNLEKRGYRFAAVYDTTYYEIKQDTTLKDYYKKCVWYGRPLANRKYFFGDLKSNIIKLIGIIYMSTFPLFALMMLLAKIKLIYFLIVILPFITSFAYVFYKSIINKKLTLTVFLLPFLMIYKSVGLQIGFLQEIFRGNKLKEVGTVKLKYNVYDPYPFGSHAKMVKLIGTNKKVLEVGCATGYISKRLKENGCSVIGIEIDPISSEVAKRYCDDVIVDDVESLKEIPYKEKSFDVILFGDILEHLKYPQNILEKSEKYLKDDGFICISIPNIANWRIRLNLLFGKFEYTEGGLLDESHLRFFTKKTAEKFILDAGFRIIKFDVTPSLPLFIPGKVRYRIAKLFPSLFGYQFLFVAKENGEMKQ